MSLSPAIQRHSSATTPSKEKIKGFRPDIQGLRAFAVIVVILDHLMHWPSGGFIGVDVFFVISGFLITGHLLREYEKTGHISFVDFYRKRIKRIMPAATLVLVVTVAVAYMTFSTSRFLGTLWDAFWGFLFGANWRFAAMGTDYFQADGPVSPLQHFWSLAVEEQFYFVWPWLLLLAFAVFLRGQHQESMARARKVAAAAILIISGLSLYWAIVETVSNPGVAYFSTFSRGWELGVGALLAVIAPVFSRLTGAARIVIAWLGLAGLVTSLFLISSSTAFPAPAALLPVLSTAAVIAAGIGADSFRTLGVLTNPVSRYLGDISYSLYLWHFPIIIIAGTLVKETNPAYYLVVVAAILLASVFAYHLVENPARKLNWLGGSKPTKRKSIVTDGYKNLWLAFMATLVAAAFAFAFVPRPAAPVDNGPAIVRNAASVEGEKPAFSAAVTVLQGNINEALQATSWPELNPSMDDLGAASKAPELGEPGCLNPMDLTNPSQCTFGSGSRSAVVVGDSIAISWIPGVRAALEPEGYTIHGIGLSNCPFADVAISIENDPETSSRCNEGHEPIYDQIRAAQPDLVIVSDAVAGIVNLGSGAEGGAAQTEWTEGLTAALKAIADEGTEIVILSPNPTGVTASDCYTKFSSPSDCESPVSQAWSDKNTADQDAADGAKVRYVDTSNWFCASGRCPIFAGGAPIRWDGMHLTEAYSRSLGPALAEVLLD